MPAPQPTSEFDRYAADYKAQLEKGLRLTGESADYYANGRVRWTAMRLAGHAVRHILDFGCGTGTAAPFLMKYFPSARIFGVDVSSESIAQAQALHPRATFCTPSALDPAIRFDLVYCNGVFHHIPPDQRPAALAQIRAVLSPAGRFALWENNPINPGTRWVMSRVEFDRDAIVIYPHQARRLLRQNGFSPIGADYLFFFPSPLAFLRRLEPALCRLPLGGQYLTLACSR